MKNEDYLAFLFLCPPSKKGGHIALLFSVGMSVGPPTVYMYVHLLRRG